MIIGLNWISILILLQFWFISTNCCQRVFAQEIPPLFISEPNGPDTLTIQLTQSIGYGPFKSEFSVVGLHDEGSPWYLAQEVVKGVPDTLTNISIRTFNFQLEQHAFHNYRIGLLEQGFYEAWQGVANSDTTKLTEKRVDQMVSVLLGTDSRGGDVVIFDTNNNEDFSDEIPLLLSEPDSSLSEKISEIEILAKEVQFEFFDGETVRVSKAPLALYPDLGFYGGHPLMGRKDHRSSLMSINGFSYRLAVSNGFSKGLYQKDNIEVLLGDGNGEILSEEQGNISLRIGDIVPFGGIPYKIHAVDLLGEQITLTKATDEAGMQGSRIGVYASDIEAETVDGDSLSLSSLRGKYVLLDFWGTWCPPCREEIPFLREAYETFERDQLEIIGIALDDRDAMVKYIQENAISWPQIHQDWSRHPIISDYKIQGYPTTLLINPEGYIVARNTSLRGNKLLELLNQYIAAK